jgi:hypothetical protein
MKPTLIQQYGPLLAALIALAGVLITLRFSSQRDQKRFRLQREDDYRREQRQTVALIATAAQALRDSGGSYTEPTTWSNGDYFQLTRIKNEVNSALANLLNQLTVARLLVHDEALQTALDGLFHAYSDVNIFLRSMVIGSSHTRTQAVNDVDEMWSMFDKAADSLQYVALTRLRPTVVSEGSHSRD